MANPVSFKESAAGDEPMWPSFLALLAVGGLFLAIPANISLFPRWLLLGIMLVCAVLSEIAHNTNRHQYCRLLGFVSIFFVTVAMIWSVILLILAIPQHIETPAALLRSAMALWATNIFVFAVWYWRLDAGGPHERAAVPGHDAGAFLFPQMTVPEDTELAKSLDGWSPAFMDYLFLAFNTSTALSPTDVPVLSRWAKGLMMIQSTISLAVVALLAARAVNIL